MSHSNNPNPYGQYGSSPAGNSPQAQGYAQNQGYPQQPTTPPKKKWYQRMGCMIPLGILVLIIIAVAAGGAGKNDNSANNKPAQSAENSAPGNENGNSNQPQGATGKHTMQYVLETDGSNVNATSAGKGGNVSQEQGVPSGWTKDVEFDNKWDALGANMSGQLDGGGVVTCRMLWDGQVVAENQSSGEYAMVTCSPDHAKMK